MLIKGADIIEKRKICRYKYEKSILYNNGYTCEYIQNIILIFLICNEPTFLGESEDGLTFNNLLCHGWRFLELGRGEEST